jgi:non-ribosomal peptide synthetase component F
MAPAVIQSKVEILDLPTLDLSIHDLPTLNMPTLDLPTAEVVSDLNGIPVTEMFPSKPQAGPFMVTQLIRHQVEMSPQRFAVHCEHEQPYTYAELWDLVGQIVKQANFAPEHIIPVCMDPSVEFVATLLAILLSGAAYVVLDPDGSLERNRLIVADCNATAVVVQEKYASMFDHIISIERVLSVPEAARQSRNNISDLPGASSSNLAYLIYTSGESSS